MAWWDVALQIISHPAVQPLLQQAMTGPTAQEDQALQRIQQERAALEALLAELPATPPRRRRAGTAPAPAAVPAIRDALVRVAADYKEALRFARADGMTHPEVQDRLADAEAHISEVERYWMAPERLAGLPDRAQPVVQDLLAQFRTFRQAALNDTTSVEALTARAAEAGTQAAQWTALAAALPAVGGGTPVAPAASRTLEQRPPSTYAPEMPVGVSCLPCGRAHLAATAASLRKAAQLDLPEEERASRLSMAQEELTALLAFDWTPEKIQATPEPDRSRVAAVVPQVQALLDRVRTARTPADLAAAADQAEAIRLAIREVPPDGTTMGAAVH
ncbi:MAG: hypothetical protein OWV35_00860 [Firmicutes bacterium]|nr:hypothetical protein [Bacillota bacterium]